MTKVGYDPRYVVFLCFPIRLLTFFHGGLTFFFSWFLFFGRDRLGLYLIGGGYTGETRLLQGLVDFIGIWGGAFGAYAAYQNSKSWLTRFLWFQLYRWINLIVCALIDIPAISRCELWLSNLHEQIQKDGFSATMFQIAFDGKCSTERTAYYICTGILLLSWFYLGICSLKYQQFLREIPNIIDDFSFDMLDIKSKTTLLDRNSKNYGSITEFNGTSDSPCISVPIQRQESQTIIERTVLPKGNSGVMTNLEHTKLPVGLANLEHTKLPVGVVPASAPLTQNDRTGSVPSRQVPPMTTSDNTQFRVTNNRNVNLPLTGLPQP